MAFPKLKIHVIPKDVVKNFALIIVGWEFYIITQYIASISDLILRIFLDSK